MLYDWLAHCQNTCARPVPDSSMPAVMGRLEGIKVDMRNTSGMVSPVSGCTADCTPASAGVARERAG